LDRITKRKPDVGLEPTTLRLRVSRATDCASRACWCCFDRVKGFSNFYIASKILQTLVEAIREVLRLKTHVALLCWIPMVATGFYRLVG
jgi:hypothetical protein